MINSYNYELKKQLKVFNQELQLLIKNTVLAAKQTHQEWKIDWNGWINHNYELKNQQGLNQAPQPQRHQKNAVFVARHTQQEWHCKARHTIHNPLAWSTQRKA